MSSRQKKKGIAATVLELVIAAALVLILVISIVNVSSESRNEGRLQLEDSVRRAALACYAAEGIYPDSLSSLEEHYGLQIDTDRYSVHYDAFAENIMPDITVIRKGV